MNKRSMLGILAFIIMGGIFYYEFYLESGEIRTVVETSERSKPETIDKLLPSATDGQIVHHNYYSLSYREKHEQAEWVAYELRKDQLVNSDFKRPYFEIDRAVKTGAASWRNYKNSGYDRGHLCAAADREFSLEAFNETFLTSNISPQEHKFNAGVWNRLEQKTRYWARKYDGVYIVTGGVLTKGLPTIGNEKVSVPKYFYKIIYDYDAEPKKAIAFLIPHQETKLPLYKFVVSIDAIESMSKIDFFPELEDSLENSLEANRNYKSWSF